MATNPISDEELIYSDDDTERLLAAALTPLTPAREPEPQVQLVRTQPRPTLTPDEESLYHRRISTLQQEKAALAEELEMTQKKLEAAINNLNAKEAVVHNLQNVVMRQNASSRRAVAEGAAQMKELKSCPPVAPELGGKTAQLAVKTSYTLCQRSERTTRGKVVQVFYPHELVEDEFSFESEVLMGPIFLVMPNIVRADMCCGKCGQAVKCEGISSIKPLYTTSGPGLFVTLTYKCFSRTGTAANAKDNRVTAHQFSSSDIDFAKKNGFAHELTRFREDDFVFDAALIELMISLYGNSPCSLEDVVRCIRGVYCREYYGRLSSYLSRVRQEVPRRGQIDFGTLPPRLRGIKNDLNDRGIFKLQGHWRGPNAKMIKSLIISASVELQPLQDRFIENHLLGADIISGDHQFSANKYILSRDGEKQYIAKGLYSVLTGEHFVGAIVWVDTESYAALANLFELIKQKTRINVFYVDKCCGRGSFGEHIRNMFTVDNEPPTVLLDFFHAMQRGRRAVNGRSSVVRAFHAEFSKAHWEVTDAQYRGHPIHDIPQNAKRIPNSYVLKSQVVACWEKFRSSDEIVNAATTKWFETHMTHVENGCISDPPRELSFVGSDGRIRTMRGTTKNEGLHRILAQVCQKGTSTSHELRAFSQRVAVVQHNVDQGVRIKNWPDIPMCDLVAYIRVTELAVECFNEQFENVHPLVSHSEPLIPLFERYHYVPTFDGIKPIYQAHVNAVVTTFPNRPPPKILAECRGTMSEVAPSPHDFSPLGLGVTEGDARTLLGALTALFFCQVEGQGVDEANSTILSEQLRQLLLDLAKAFSAQFSLYVPLSDAYTTNLADMVNDGLSANGRTAAGTQRGFLMILKVFTTLTQVPIFVVSPLADHAPVCVLPHPDVRPSNDYVPQTAHVLVLRACGWLRPVFSPALCPTFEEEEHLPAESMQEDEQVLVTPAPARTKKREAAQLQRAALSVPANPEKPPRTKWLPVEDKMLITLRDRHRNTTTLNVNWKGVLEAWQEEYKKREELHRTATVITDENHPLKRVDRCETLQSREQYLRQKGLAAQYVAAARTGDVEQREPISEQNVEQREPIVEPNLEQNVEQREPIAEPNLEPTEQQQQHSEQTEVSNEQNETSVTVAGKRGSKRERAKKEGDQQERQERQKRRRMEVCGGCGGTFEGLHNGFCENCS